MQVILDREIYDLAKRVAEDLEHIRSTWSFEMPEAVLRRESVLLRRMLVEDEYARAWRAVGLSRQPMVRATSLDGFLGSVDRKYVAYAFAPLARRLTVDMQQLTIKSPSPQEGDLLITAPGYNQGLGLVMILIPRAEADGKGAEALSQEVAGNLGGKREWGTYAISDLLRSPAALISGTTINRREIIKYVANRLGGAHGGGQRNPVEWQLLDSQWGLLEHLNSCYLELLSIGLFFADSTDATRYIQEFSRIEEPPPVLGHTREEQR